MKKLYIYLIVLVVSIQYLHAQTLEWSHIFDTHSIGTGITPNSLIDDSGKITTIVVENDILKLYQTLEDGTITNLFNSNKVVNGEYTPLIRVVQNEQAFVFKAGSHPGAFWLLQTDADLNMTRESQLVLPAGIVFPSIYNLIEYNEELYITMTTSGNHYLLKINDDDTLSVVYNGSISVAYGEEYVLLDNGDIIFSYKNSNGHMVRCVSIEKEKLVWERTIDRNHGILLEYRMVKNGNILYTAGLERAWVDGIADDELGISHIDIATGNILFQASMELPYCSGCFLGFENFVYNIVNNHMYITYVSGFPEAAVSIVEINNLSANIIKQTYFPFEYDPILSSIGDRSFIHIQPDGKVILLYKSYKNATEKSNLYVTVLDADLKSTGTLEINFPVLESVEHPTDILTFDDDRILITGIVPDSNPFIFWEQVEYFTVMINIAGALSLENLTLDSKQITLYPNPAVNRVNFIVTDDVHELTIFDVSGKVVHKEKIAQQIFDLDLSTYQTGVYFVNLSGHQKKHIKKLIVK